MRVVFRDAETARRVAELALKEAQAFKAGARKQARRIARVSRDMETALDDEAGALAGAGFKSRGAGHE